MKKTLPLLLAAVLILTGCASETLPEPTARATEPAPAPTYPALVAAATGEILHTSRFDSETTIVLSDDGITVDGGGETDAVYTSHDILYYEDRDTYDSGNPYGEGETHERHTAQEAAAHTVVNITAPGAYRLSGKLSAGQIRIDLGEDAYEDPDAVVELILDNAHITCTVAPAVLFLNTYECDGLWSADTARSDVDTSAAGANLILEGKNTVTGSHVARIYKDTEGEEKLWKQDGAIYSYMSMNVYGPGALDLTADNEGLDTELHLTLNGGNIAIRSDNDGINTNEDGVSVTTVNAGTLHIIAGLGAEGDGIDSNGYLVINGGTVVASANPAADAGLDSDMGSFVNGGTVIALGSTMDWAESDSNQITMNLQFAQHRSGGSAIVVTREDGAVVFAYDPDQDEVLGENTRQYMGAVISCPNFLQSQSYYVCMDGTITGDETGGVYDVTTVTGYEGGTRMMYTGTDVKMGGGPWQKPWDFEGEGPQRPEGEMPEGFDPGSRGERPGDFTFPEGEMPEDFQSQRPEMPEGFDRQRPGMPEGFDGQRPELPEGETFPQGQFPEGGFGGRGQGGMNDMQPGAMAGEAGTLFYMQDKVNAFSGLCDAEEALPAE